MYLSHMEFDKFVGNSDLPSLLQLNRVDLKLPSFKVTSFDRTPLFFYHIPKTAGLTFRNVLITSMLFADRHWGRQDFPHNREEIFSWNEEYSEHWFKLQHNFVSAWRPFGFHQNFEQKFNLVTIFREPFARVVSRFRYKCYFGEFECSDAGFRQFFTMEKNCNHQTKLISGVGDTRPIYGDDLQTALLNLDQFYAYCTIGEVDDFLTELLSIYGLPNVVGQRNNVSLEQYKLDWDKFKDEVLAANALDTQLYDYVVKNPKRPDVSLDRSQVSKIVNLTRERDQNDVFRCVCHEVEFLNKQIQQALESQS